MLIRLVSLVLLISTCWSFKPAEKVLLKAGTPVSLQLNESINSDEAQQGSIIQLMVRNDVIINGKVLIKAGSLAEGWIKEAYSGCRRCSTRCAKLVLVAQSTQAVDGQRIYLKGIPHTIKGDCRKFDTAKATIGTILSARVLNNVRVMI